MLRNFLEGFYRWLEGCENRSNSINSARRNDKNEANSFPSNALKSFVCVAARRDILIATRRDKSRDKADRMCEINHITVVIKNQLNLIKSESSHPHNLKRSRSNDVISRYMPQQSRSPNKIHSRP